MPNLPHASQTRRALDPSNGVAEFGALRLAVDAHNDEALDAAIAAIGRSERIDIYWTTLFGRLGTALASTHPLSESEALTTIAGSLAALPRVSCPQASNACKGDGLQRPVRRDACRRLAASFERGDGMLTEGLGAAIALRVWPSGSPEWAEAAQLRRVEHYRMQVFTQHPDPLKSPRAAHRYIELLAQHRREQDVFAAELLAEAIPPDPPANWVDPTPN